MRELAREEVIVPLVMWLAVIVLVVQAVRHKGVPNCSKCGVAHMVLVIAISRIFLFSKEGTFGEEATDSITASFVCWMFITRLVVHEKARKIFYLFE